MFVERGSGGEGWGKGGGGGVLRVGRERGSVRERGGRLLGGGAVWEGRTRWHGVQKKKRSWRVFWLGAKKGGGGGSWGKKKDQRCLSRPTMGCGVI
ncbi:hypothetical protein, partial [Neisseria sp. P0024.S002]|uniref:hypothetical protein n=1 Tax=Neisseria sp. P0024.S002 TaxID=3436846 RepID=UPI003F8135C6